MHASPVFPTLKIYLMMSSIWIFLKNLVKTVLYLIKINQPQITRLNKNTHLKLISTEFIEKDVTKILQLLAFGMSMLNKYFT